MEGFYKEFENENGLRSYPFAAGCVPPASEELEIPDGVFVDASLYPVNLSGTVYLSGISEDGVFSVSDDNGVIMTGVRSGQFVEFVDASGISRASGVLVASSADALESFALKGYERKYRPENTAFAASCVFPVPVVGVESISIGGSRPASEDVSFENGQEDEVRVSSGELEDGRRTLRFDVLPKPGSSDAGSIKRIICVVDGKTPFRIAKLSYNVVMLTLDGIDREAVCSVAGGGGGFEMRDTCGSRKGGTSSGEPAEAYEMLEVYIPPDPNGLEGGLADGAENAFFIVTPNLVGYSNPISVTIEEGSVSPNTEGVSVDVDGISADIAEGEMSDSVTSKSVVIQVPGLSGGIV